MPVTPLDNARWGFESNCFVCEPRNETGLRLRFFHDDTAGLVVADLNLGSRFSGPPRYVHGGVILAVLDEAMAWATIALAGSFALTRTSEARFRRPVALDQPHRVEARVVDDPGDGTLAMAGVVVDGLGRCCVEATACFAVMSPAVAGAAIGPLVGDDAGFVRG